MDNNQSHNGFEAAMPEELVSALGTPDESWLLYMRQLRADFARLMMEYNAGINEVMTKIGILQEEFVHLHRYNPIEHVSSRVKKPDSLIKKVVSKGIGLSTESIRASITDIAGVRVTCSFIADTYRVLDALTKQDDVKVLEIKDYIEDPKPSGYKSLHAIIEVPVFLSTGPVPVVVEVQIRTIAMDFWASLEHKIFYKYDREVPDRLIADLRDAAKVAEQLDLRMQELHREIHGDPSSVPEDLHIDLDENIVKQLWEATRQGDTAKEEQGDTLKGDTANEEQEDTPKGDTVAREDGAEQ